jgi:hypothetical protein
VPPYLGVAADAVVVVVCVVVVVVVCVVDVVVGVVVVVVVLQEATARDRIMIRVSSNQITFFATV